MKFFKKSTILVGIVAIFIFCLIVALIYNSSYYRIQRLIDPNNSGLIKEDLINSEEMASRIALVYFREHLPDILENDLLIQEREGDWLITITTQSITNMDITISKHNGGLRELLVYNRYLLTHHYIRNKVVGEKSTAIEIARIIFEEKYPEYFAHDNLQLNLDAEKIGGNWLVFLYSDKTLFGHLPIVQISAKTGEVIRIILG